MMPLPNALVLGKNPFCGEHYRVKSKDSRVEHSRIFGKKGLITTAPASAEHSVSDIHPISFIPLFSTQPHMQLANSADRFWNTYCAIDTAGQDPFGISDYDQFYCFVHCVHWKIDR